MCKDFVHEMAEKLDLFVPLKKWSADNEFTLGLRISKKDQFR